jgi:8-oxo-dGTP diphosphatase
MIRPRPAVGIGVVIEAREKVLLVKRKGPHGGGSWSTPGGYLEFGESPVNCARREAWEETGVNIAGVGIAAITNDIFERPVRHFVTIWMRCVRASGQVKVNSLDEIEEVGWFPWNGLPKPLFLPFRNLIRGNRLPFKIRRIWNV